MTARAKASNFCVDAFSFRRKTFEHEAGEEKFYCRRCRAYMGCEFCAQRRSELVCWRCHDWALNDGERAHGRMADRDRAAQKVGALYAQATRGIG